LLNQRQIVFFGMVVVVFMEGIQVDRWEERRFVGLMSVGAASVAATESLTSPPRTSRTFPDRHGETRAGW
jgi:hypothetical protein